MNKKITAKTKISALVLAFAMIFQILPVNALASETQNKKIVQVQTQATEPKTIEQETEKETAKLTENPSSTAKVSEKAETTSTQALTQSITNQINKAPVLKAPPAAKGGVQLTPANNWFKVDPNNTVLKTESDFSIGKMGTLEFALSFKFSPSEIPVTQRQNVAVVFTVPSGFTVNKQPSLAGVKITKKTQADGSTTVTCTIDDSGVTTALLGQFTLRQDGRKLLNELPKSNGVYNFDMQVFTDYGTANQTELFTSPSPTGPVGRVTFQTNATAPTWEITDATADTKWVPGDISYYGWGAGRGRGWVNTAGGQSWASDSAKAIMAGDSTGADIGKPIIVTFKKSEGYITERTLLDIVFPKEGVLFENDNGRRYFTFTADTGEVLTNPAYFSSQKGSELIINGATLASLTSGNNYSNIVNNLSWTDIFYKAGTFRIEYRPVVYYNRLYNGDWSKTDYTADNPSYVSFKDNNGNQTTVTGDSVRFQFVQGGETISLGTQVDLSIPNATSSNLTKLAQYQSSADKYNDSEILTSRLTFKHNSDFKIMDNLVLAYDYEEALTPVELSDLRTSKQYGFTYRIFVKDAKTGNVTKIITLVDEESAPTYTAETINGVTETVVDAGAMTEWKFNDADAPNNSLYISRIEVLKKEYEYNLVGAGTIPNGAVSTWFSYRLRAYHSRLSDGSDIPDNYSAKIKRSVTSDQITAQGDNFSKEYTVLTLHKKDNAELLESTVSPGDMEVNDHSVTGLYKAYNVKKYSDTMQYNTDADGKTVPYDSADYDPVVVELSGDAITVTDRLNRNHQRLLGIVGSDDKFYDFIQMSFDPEKFLCQGDNRYSYDKETVVSSTNHNDNTTGAYQTELYKLDEICNALGVTYAKKLIIGVDGINEVVVPNEYINIPLQIYINKVFPGHMNYNGVIGTNGSADLPKTLSFRGALFCRFSDYKNEVVLSQPAHDEYGGTKYHGSAKSKRFTPARFVEGGYNKKVSVVDQDYYVNPYSAVSDMRGKVISGNTGDSLIPDSERICNSLAQVGKGTSGETGPIELTRIGLDTVSKAPLLQYKDLTVDFAGTDPKLLSLANTVSFTKNGWMQKWDFTMEYTLSNGETKTVTDSLKQAWANPISDNPRSHYIIPGVDIANNVYLTSLKITFPNDKNWGANSIKWAPGVQEHQGIPEIGLGMYNVNIPNMYSGTNVAVGSVSDKETDDEYDKLNVKATLSFKNIFGETKTADTASFVAEGASNRIASQKITVHKFSTTPTVFGFSGVTTVNQGDAFAVNGSVTWSPTDNTKKLLTANDVRLRPTYYYVVDPNFTYINDSAGVGQIGNDEYITVKFYPAGIGENKSGTKDYGLLKVSYSDAAFDKLYSAVTGNPAYSSIWNRNNIRFNLRANYNANPVVVRPIHGVWMDVERDANRDGNGGNEQNIIVETVNDNNQLLNGAPMGDNFGNTLLAKDTDNDGKAEMLYVSSSLTVKINEQAIQGISPYAIATTPYSESTDKVTSRDYINVENLFSERMFMYGNDAITTKNWEVYVPIMKKGTPQKYLNGENLVSTERNDFSVDYMDIDTSDLDDSGLAYKVYYSTDNNPASNGYTSAKNAGWTLFKASDGTTVSPLPADLSQVTMIKVTIDEIEAKDKVFFDLKYKLHEHKSEIGSKIAQNTLFANFSLEGSDEPYFKDAGQSAKPVAYELVDMEIKGFVWNETDYNSLYNSETDTKVSRVEMKLFTDDGNEVAQTNSSDKANNRNFYTNSNGQYTLYMPHDGNWTVAIVPPNGKNLVNPKVTADQAVTSAFDRVNKTASVSFTANPDKKQFTLENVNGGLYSAPVITLNTDNTLIHVKDKNAGTVTSQVANPVPGSTLKFRFNSGVPLNIAEFNDLGNGTANFNGISTGVVKCTAYADDGYNGEITKDFYVTVYNKVIYDNNQNTPVAGTVTGSVTDTKQYYPSNDEATDTVTVNNGTALSRTGYTLSGWDENPTATTPSYPTNNSSFRTGSKNDDIRLFAIWTPINYTIVFNKNTKSTNGLDLATTPANTMNNLPMTYDIPKELTENAFTVDGYKFIGWNDKADGTGNGYTDKQTVNNLTAVDGTEITLYAQWEPHTYTIVFDKNTVDSENNPLVGTPTGTNDNKPMTYGKPDALPNNNYSLEGYTFGGWTYTDDNNVSHTLNNGETVSNLTKTDKGTVVLKALWNINNYNVSYEYTADVPLAPELPTATTNKYNSEVTVQPAPSLTGYDFSGWQLPNGITANNGKFNMPSRDVVISGSWTPHTYTVEYDKNSDDATGTTTPSNHIYDEESKLTPNGYENPGFVFTGWTIDPNGNTPVYEDNATVKNLTADSNGTVTLYALWRQCIPVTADPPVKKEISGHQDPTDEIFTFTLTAESTTARLDKMPMPASANGELTMEANIVGAGSHEFGDITFTKPGTYIYKMTEKDDGLTGYTYDKSVYTVEYLITQEGDTLRAERTISKDGKPADDVVFVNNYVPTPIKTSQIPVEKVIGGDKPTADETFLFTVTAENGESPLPNQREIAVKGAGKAEFGEIDFTKAGTYVYRISEKNTGAQNYKFDESVYTVSFIVTDVGGELETTGTITKNGKEFDRAVFTNEYAAPAVGSTNGSVKTGDGNSLLLWVTTMLISLLATSLLFYRKKKEKRQ